jgi:hypothetical protein
VKMTINSYVNSKSLSLEKRWPVCRNTYFKTKKYERFIRIYMKKEFILKLYMWTHNFIDENVFNMK